MRLWRVRSYCDLVLLIGEVCCHPRPLVRLRLSVCPWGTRWYSRSTHVGPESHPSARPAASVRVRVRVRVRVFLLAPPSRTYSSPGP